MWLLDDDSSPSQPIATPPSGNLRTFVSLPGSRSGRLAELETVGPYRSAVVSGIRGEQVKGWTPWLNGVLC